ncbi:hypothetical protein EW145_g4343 [Phellinidium pouzarii]|uniref:AAA+ ATPase domain-containing protein n=1 Tax=Phellinidium pouzarii TaxID=167371 RepID=A0A4S4L412_9AGAM|nr:hypothetical protein EW145_g4343 [Phellinidium pouzarii]
MQELEAEERAVRRGFISNKNPDDPPARFSDPRHLNWLPFPHTTAGQPGRFSLQRQSKVVVFPFIGRHVFRRVYECAEEFDRDPFRSYSKVNLYGCAGTGKSHVLAALACLLTHEGKRVVYVPDCALLLESFFIEMRGALQFAFPEYASTMDAWSEVDQIRDFCRGWRKSGAIFFVIDQREALDAMPDDPDKDRKGNVRLWLDELLSRNFVAFSASAESKTYRPRPGKRTNIKDIAMQSGFDEEEMSWWWKHNLKSLPSVRPDERKFVEDLTGSVPLLLRPLLRLKDRQFVDAKEQFMASEELVHVRTCVLGFLAQRQDTWPASVEKAYELSVMS